MCPRLGADELHALTVEEQVVADVGVRESTCCLVSSTVHPDPGVNVWAVLFRVENTTAIVTSFGDGPVGGANDTDEPNGDPPPGTEL